MPLPLLRRSPSSARRFEFAAIAQAVRVCTVGGFGVLVASTGVAGAAERTEPVRQPRIIQVVPDAQGRPWQMEIRPSLSLAQAKADREADSTDAVPPAPKERRGMKPGSRSDASNGKSPVGDASKPKQKPSEKAKPKANKKKSGSRPNEATRRSAPAANDKPVPPPADPAPTDSVEFRPRTLPNEQATPIETSPFAPLEFDGAFDGGSTATVMTGGPIDIRPAAPSDLKKGYLSTYKAIPHNPRLEHQRPGYRHELTVLLLTGETLPPVSTPDRAHYSGFGPAGPVAPPTVTPYRPYLPAQWDYYQAQPPQFRLLNPYLYPGFRPIRGPFGY